MNREKAQRQDKVSDSGLTDLEGLEQAAECLRTLAHPHRLRMLQMLLRNEYTVGELAEACGIPSHMASEHLVKMRDRGLLESERRGRRIYYQIVERGLESILGCVERRYGCCSGESPGQGNEYWFWRLETGGPGPPME